MHPAALSRAQARSVALAAQGFVGRPSGSVGTAQLRALIRRLGALQIDSVNVLVRSQYLPAFARLGAYDRAYLDRAAYARPRRVFEYWGHEASLLPIELFPYLRWRMQQSERGTGVWNNVARVGRERKDLIRRVLRSIADDGPLAASDIADEKGTGGWWSWSDAKRAVEFLFWCGKITPLKRRSSFERVYDLIERVLPADVLKVRVSPQAAMRELVTRSARALGVATEADLRDYFRLPLAAARTAVRELVESNELLPVLVEGWKQQAYLHKDARVPRNLPASALLSPFDSLVWNRPRTERLFDFHYRIEIYTPAHKRRHGYYVLPYLCDGELVARVDAKADRARSILLVHAIHYEDRADKRAVRERLEPDLRALAAWLNLTSVTISH